MNDTVNNINDNISKFTSTQKSQNASFNESLQNNKRSHFEFFYKGIDLGPLII